VYAQTVSPGKECGEFIQASLQDQIR